MSRGRRNVYIGIFFVAALIAAALVYLAQPRTEVVRARADIAVLTPITAEMVELVRVSPGQAPPHAARSMKAVVGRYASVPVLAGQDVDVRVLESTPGQRALGFGAPLAPGQVAFALPVEPGQAVGGALSPGALVDVVAVPSQATVPRAGSSPPAPTLLGQRVTVLAVRTADGQALVDPSTRGDRDRVAVPPKLGSVVVAIPAARLKDYAAAAARSLFYVALSPQGDPAAATP